jgi:serine kinase of HPr protein (carbohydrate metabolism regulator)
MSSSGKEKPPDGTGGSDTVHATCIVVGEAGILIRGESGTGKSALARAIVETANRAGRFARLVSDDRTRIAQRHGRLVAQVVPSIAGRIEARGAGILAVAHEPGAVVRLVVDITNAEPPRLPAPEDQTIVLCGVVVPRLRQCSNASSPGLVLGSIDSDLSGIRIA